MLALISASSTHSDGIRHLASEKNNKWHCSRSSFSFLPTFFSSMRATHERWHYGQYKSIGIYMEAQRFVRRLKGGCGYLLNEEGCLHCERGREKFDVMVIWGGTRMLSNACLLYRWACMSGYNQRHVSTSCICVHQYLSRNHILRSLYQHMKAVELKAYESTSTSF